MEKSMQRFEQPSTKESIGELRATEGKRRRDLECTYEGSDEWPVGVQKRRDPKVIQGTATVRFLNLESSMGMKKESNAK